MMCKEFGRLTGAKYDKMYEQSKRIYSIDGLSPTIHTMQGGNTEVKVAISNDVITVGRTDEHQKGGVAPTVKENHGTVTATIQKIDIPQTVRVRKYPVDCKLLCECLRDYKAASNFTNKEIAEQLDRPLTEVEHWFRNDQYFSIPDENIWFALKELLGIETNCFDESIMTFEEKEGVFEKSERHYFPEGLSPTLTCMSGNEKILVPCDSPLALDEQNKYIRTDGTVGTIMTDGRSPKHNNRVLEPKWVSEKGVNYICDPKRGMCTDINAEVAQPITAVGQSNWTGSFVSPDIEKLEKSSTIGSNEPVKIHLKNGKYVTSDDDLSQYRIRKLTPKECWRLMGFDDTDFDKAEKVCSNTQLYKQAGNSCVINVLEGILGALLPKQTRSEWLDELLGV